ncbi:hypothetical protein GALL_254220 [mine drainage metagenome]|uniref:DUF3095 domain-containing protein n=1 Tax=mine drainage metagenome TaxID=410659 RepID=A0A1J5RKU9_9ZZZZ
MKDSRYFYRDLMALESFADAMQPRLHAHLPDDWWIAVADVVGSTNAIQAGKYKDVNTVGVACISAVANVDRSIDIPFVFGGDGATFAVPDIMVKQAISAFRGAQKLSRASFGLDLRVGLIKVGDLVGRGFWTNVAKVRLSPHMTQSAFSGRGWEEAERMVKTPGAPGIMTVSENDGPAEASFEGFECRWQGVPNFHGHKLSLLIAAMSDDPVANLATYREVTERVQAIYGNEADYHPLRPGLMHLTLNPQLLSHEWRVRSSQSGLGERLRYFMRMLLQNLAGIYLFARNLDTEAVKWSRYRNELVENTDFRKFDGVLRMIIDGSDTQAAELEAYLESKHRAKLLVYGMHKSREALVTCLVQSYTGNHLHFVDGGDGGYAMAAKGFKQRLKSFKGGTA